MQKTSVEDKTHAIQIASKPRKDVDDGGGGVGGANRIIVNAALGATETRIRINKWRVREGQNVSAAQILFLYQQLGDDGKPIKEGDATFLKYKSNQAGVVRKRLRKEGEIVIKGWVFPLHLLLLLFFICESKSQRMERAAVGGMQLLHHTPHSTATHERIHKMFSFFSRSEMRFWSYPNAYTQPLSRTCAQTAAQT